MRRSRVDDRERGAALPLLSVAFAMLLVSIWIIAAVGERAVDRTRAQSAADAAALAGVADGEAVARTVARRNGGELTAFSQEGNEVVVTVEVAGVQAVARAERRLAPP